MNTPKFTPGPWEVLRGGRYASQFASIISPDPTPEYPERIFEITKIWCNKIYSIKQVEIDAALIAAAPELYELLAGVGKFLNDSIKLEQPCFDSPPEPASEWDHNAGQCLDEIQRLLAKARGEKQ